MGPKLDLEILSIESALLDDDAASACIDIDPVSLAAAETALRALCPEFLGLLEDAVATMWGAAEDLHGILNAGKCPADVISRFRKPVNFIIECGGTLGYRRMSLVARSLREVLRERPQHGVCIALINAHIAILEALMLANQRSRSDMLDRCFIRAITRLAFAIAPHEAILGSEFGPDDLDMDQQPAIRLAS